jgi:hypothetical protein
MVSVGCRSRSLDKEVVVVSFCSALEESIVDELSAQGITDPTPKQIVQAINDYKKNNDYEINNINFHAVVFVDLSVNKWIIILRRYTSKDRLFAICYSSNDEIQDADAVTFFSSDRTIEYLDGYGAEFNRTKSNYFQIGLGGQNEYN